MLTVIKGVVLVASILGLAAGCWSLDQDGDAARGTCASYEFDTAKWLELQDEDAAVGRAAEETRRAMATSLVNCRRLDGLSRDGVQRLLGPPTHGGRRDIDYYIGEERGPFAVDEEYLFIEFDDKRRVVKYIVAGG